MPLDDKCIGGKDHIIFKKKYPPKVESTFTFI